MVPTIARLWWLAWAFWVGVGFQNGLIFPELVHGFAGGILENGMTAGGLTAILLTGFMELTASRRRRLNVPFGLSKLPEIRNFLSESAKKYRWDSAVEARLVAVAEEALLTLLNRDEQSQDEAAKRHLLLTIQKEGSDAVMEVVVAPGDTNLEDRMAHLGEHADEVSVEKEISLRILRHYASSVHHQQYHDTDIITITVDVP